MRIAIDLTGLLPESTGCDVYMKQLVRAIGRVDKRNRYDIFVNAEDRRLFDGQLPDSFSVIPLCFRPRAVRLLFQQGVLPASALLRRAQVIHSPSFISPQIRLGRRQVVTVHDMTFFSLPGYHIPLRRSAAFKELVLRSIRGANAVLVPSTATRDHIAELVPGLPPQKTRLIPYGIGEEFFIRTPEETAANAKRLNLPDRFILAVGTIEPRKNLGRLIDAFRQLTVEHGLTEHLVLAGRLGWNYEEILAKIEDPTLAGRIHLTGFVSAEDLPWYYAAATVCAYPSIQEGFGFPPLEAMACGVPVISSRSSSLTENLEGAAELIDPTDASAIAAALLRLLRDPDLHARTRQAGLARAARFSWDSTARQTVEVYEARA